MIILFLPQIPFNFCIKSLFKSTERAGGKVIVSLVSSKHIFVRVLPLFTLRSAFTAGILASSREENLIYSTAALSCPVFRLSCIFRSLARSGCISSGSYWRLACHLVVIPDCGEYVTCGINDISYEDLQKNHQTAAG